MAKSVGSIIIDLGLNSTKFNSGIDQAQRNLGKSMGKMTKDMRAVAQGGKQIDIMKVKFNELSNVVEKQERYMDKSRKQLEKWREEGKQGTVAFKELERKVENGELVLNSYNKELSETTYEMKLMKAEQTGVAKKFGEIGGKLESLSGKMSSVGSSLTKKLTLPLAGAMTYSIKKAADWESAFAGVKKTVDEIEVDGKVTYSYKRLGRELQDLAKEMPTTTTELANIAENAGQLGVATEDVVEFTRTMAMMAESTNMTSEEASMSIAKLMNIMDTAPSNVRRLSSTIVELGNNTAATEKDIVEMSLRLAGTGKTAGLSEKDVLGLSAAMSSVGINAESGGSAMSRLIQFMNNASKAGAEGTDMLESFASQFGMTGRELEVVVAKGGKPLDELASKLGMTRKEFRDMYKDSKHSSDALQQFAEISGVSAKDFVKAWEKDPAKVVNNFVKGLKKIEDGGGNAVSSLEGLEINSVVMKDTMLRLANGEKAMDKARDSANKGWKENNALIEEAKKRHETLESQLKTLKNKMDIIAQSVGGPLLKAFNKSLDLMKPYIDKVVEMARAFNDADEKTQKMILRIGGFLLAVGPVTSVLGKVVGSFGKLFKVGQKIFAKNSITTVEKGLSTASKGFGSLGGKVGGLVKNLPKVGGLFTSASGGLASFGGSATVAAGEVGTVASSIGGGAAGLGGVLTALSGPVGWAALAAVAIGVLGKSFIDEKIHSDEFKESIRGLKKNFGEFTEYATNRTKTWWETTKETLSSGNPFGKVVDTTKVLSSSIDKETQKSLGSYVKLEAGINEQLAKIRGENMLFNNSMTDDLITSYDKLADTAVKKIEERKSKEMKANRDLLQGVEGVTQEERKKSQANIDTWHTKQEQDVKESQTKVQTILQTAKDEKRTLSLVEYKELDELQNKMNESTITALTVSEESQKVILERMKNNKTAISAETASKVIKDSVNQKDKTIEAASQQRDKTIAEAIAEKEKGQISEETKNKVVKNAEKQYEDTVKNAKKMHSDTVSEMRKQNSEIANDVDIQTGNIKTKWQRFSEKYIEITSKMDDKIVGFFKNMMSKSKKETVEKSDDIQRKWNENSSNITKNAKNSTDSARKDFESNMPKIKNSVSTNSAIIQKDWRATTKSVAEDSKKGATKADSSFGWAMKMIGGTHSSKPFPWVKYEKGTGIGGHKGGHALINDQKGSKYRELTVFPNGQMILPKERNVMIPNMPKGTEVLNASKTETLQKSGMLNYAKGTGGFLSSLIDKAKGAFSKVKDWSSDIWDWVADKTKIKQLLANKTGKINHTKFDYNDKYQDKLQKTIIENGADKLFSTAESMMPAGGGSFDGAVGGHGVYKYLVDIAQKAISKFGMGGGITSGYRPGDPYSHGKRQAIDIAYPSSMNGSSKYFEPANWLFEKFKNQIAYVITQGKVRDRSGMSGQGSSGKWKHWPDNDHYDHLHVNGLMGSGDTYKGPAGGGKGPALSGSGVGRWRGQILAAAKRMRQRPTNSQVDGILAQIQLESGGNQNVTQSSSVWDVNTASGNPAKGLLQYIPQTFNAYKMRGYDNIFNGFHQLIAFFNNSNWKNDIQYGRSGWGPRGGRIYPYENGGIIKTQQMALMGEGNKPEMVVPLTKKTRAIALMRQAQDMMGIGPNSDNTVVGIMKSQNDKIDQLIQIVQYMALNSDKQQPIIINGQQVNPQNMSEDLATLSQRGRFNLGGA